MKFTPLIFLIFSINSLTLGAETKYLSLGSVKKVTLKAGKAGEVDLPIVIGAEFHIQANPASLPRLIPTTLDLTNEVGIEVGKPVYPKGNTYQQQGSQDSISVYSGSVNIKVPLAVKLGAKAGTYMIKGKLRYQACNDKICFFPMSVPVEIPLLVK